MTAFVAFLRAGDAATDDTDVLGVFNGKGAGEVGAGGEVEGGVGGDVGDGIGVVVSRLDVDELSALCLCLCLGFFLADGRAGGEEEEVGGDVSVEFDAEVLGLEEQELDGGVVLHVGYRAAVVGTDACGLEFAVLGDHSHEDVAREVEEDVGDFGDAVFVIPDGCVDFSHVSVNSGPVLAASGLHEDVVVVLQWRSGRCGIGENLMQAFAFGDAWCSPVACLQPLVHFAAALGFLLQSQELFGVGHFQAFLADVVLVGFVVDVPDQSSSHGARFVPFVVESRAVCPGLEGDVVAQVVARAVFDAEHESVVQGSPEVITLFFSHLADVAQGS